MKLIAIAENTQHLRNPPLLAVSALVLTSAFFAVALPLATYTLTLATFGLAHVLVELRYVDARFNSRIGGYLRQGVIPLLIGIVSLRILQVTGLISSKVGIPLELSCVVALVALVVPVLARRSWGLAIAGVTACATVTAGVLIAPVETLLVFAVLHNLTPVGFIAEHLRGQKRRHALIACALVFTILPLIIVSGLPEAALAAVGLVAPEASLLSVGSLSSHLGAFVPTRLQGEAIALHVFSAAVFLQCMHYAVVILVLSKWEHSDTFLPWPRPQLFHCCVMALGALLFVGFTLSFRDTRAVYGIAAAIHAWVELPILLLALAIPAETTTRPV